MIQMRIGVENEKKTDKGKRKVKENVKYSNLHDSTPKCYQTLVWLLRVQKPSKRNAKRQNGVLGGLTNSCEKKRSEKQRRKGKIQADRKSVV